MRQPFEIVRYRPSRPKVECFVRSARDLRARTSQAPGPTAAVLDTASTTSAESISALRPCGALPDHRPVRRIDGAANMSTSAKVDGQSKVWGTPLATRCDSIAAPTLDADHARHHLCSYKSSPRGGVATASHSPKAQRLPSGVRHF